MTNTTENFEKSMRFDDLIRSERYFTATLLPVLLFHNDLQGVEQFVNLVEEKATGQHDQTGIQRSKRATEYDFKDVEVITEFHIARDLKAKGLELEPMAASEDGERERRDAPDLVIIAGHGLVVCEGKFFSNFNWPDLKNQLTSQRGQISHLLRHRPQIRAYRHVAILPENPAIDIGADAVLTWDDIRVLAEKLVGPEHYVTARLRNAVKRYKKSGDLSIRNYDGILSFNDMRAKCQQQEIIEVGLMGGKGALRKLSLGDAENKSWKWRDPTNKGRVDPTNWLRGKDWLDAYSTEGDHGYRADAEHPRSSR